MDDMGLLALAAGLAHDAGVLIMAVRARGFRTTRKRDQSPVTEADHAAEALIAEQLRVATPHIPVVAEEEIAAGHIPLAASQIWLVDPLDGTREFVARRGDFVVNIGLVRDGRPVLGVVGAPAHGEMFGGIVGGPAWKRTRSGEHPIAARRIPSSGAAILSSRARADDPRIAAFLAGRHVASVVNMGSALKVCRIAEGRADLYPRFGPTMEWDTAAPQAVLEAAGGSVRTFAGEELRYGKPGWTNEGFVCAGAA